MALKRAGVGFLIVATYVIVAVAMFVGLRAVTHESKARAVAVCNSENETREQVRLLARDLTHNRDTLDKVDRRFAPKDCKHVVNHSTRR